MIDDAAFEKEATICKYNAKQFFLRYSDLKAKLILTMHTKNSSSLPNTRNLGALLRIIIIVNLVVGLIAFTLSSDLMDFFQQLAELSMLVQPCLLMSLLLLAAGQPSLEKLQYPQAAALFLLIPTLTSVFMLRVFENWFEHLPSTFRMAFSTLGLTTLILYYFHLQHRTRSPAVSEARLQALQARIRPHFLFNSINAVLSLIRSQPKQAETALEDMADLFRVVMADNRELVPLAQEIGLCRQYLALEKLRLNERLNVDWQIENMPPDTLIPPLILQPLLENAVYHGIEPLSQGGVIGIHIWTRHREIHLVLSNPLAVEDPHGHGNKIALNNIRERLMLHYDLEASLNTHQHNGVYEVHIVSPTQNG